ncbi:MAG: HPr family phosphocarrier protein [Polyangiaceae bacterium]|nr:HPr family phosphocarrier protein [Polyangiaceae bacterium]MCW5791214.1 HPr family phosphocarrier protein [Polyangiaceae bacterium]
MTAQGRFQVVNERGLHARAAAKLVTLASRYQSAVWVARDGERANAKSVMGVLLLCGAQGTWLDVEATGDDAEAAVAALGALIEAGFDEGG